MEKPPAGLATSIPAAAAGHGCPAAWPPLLGSATDGSLLNPDQALSGYRSAAPSCCGERLERTQGCAACMCTGPVQSAIARPCGMQSSSYSGKLQACLI